LGDKTGVPLLLAALQESTWDPGGNIEAFGNRGANYSRVDLLILMLGIARDERALPAILNQARQLKPGHPHSHFRAVALSLKPFASSAAPCWPNSCANPA